MITSVQHLSKLRAANSPVLPADPGRPVLAGLSDWEIILSKFRNNINDALNAKDVVPVKFTVGDMVGIYSSNGMIHFSAAMSPNTHGREYVVTYELRPIVIQPKELLVDPVDVPGSYSELNQRFVNVMLEQFRATQNSHWWWRLMTIRAGRVTPGQNYRTSLVFGRD